MDQHYLQIITAYVIALGMVIILKFVLLDSIYQKKKIKL